MCVGVGDDALVVIVGVKREVVVAVASLRVYGDNDAGSSADPFSGDDAGDTYSMYLSCRRYFSMPG